MGGEKGLTSEQSRLKFAMNNALGCKKLFDSREYPALKINLWTKFAKPFIFTGIWRVRVRKNLSILSFSFGMKKSHILVLIKNFEWIRSKLSSLSSTIWNDVKKQLEQISKNSTYSKFFPSRKNTKNQWSCTNEKRSLRFSFFRKIFNISHNCLSKPPMFSYLISKELVSNCTWTKFDQEEQIIALTIVPIICVKMTLRWLGNLIKKNKSMGQHLIPYFYSIHRKQSFHSNKSNRMWCLRSLI